MDPILPSLIARGGDHTPSVGMPPYNNGLATKLRMVSLFHRSKEGVHIDVYDLPHRSHHVRYRVWFVPTYGDEACYIAPFPVSTDCTVAKRIRRSVAREMLLT